MAVQSVRYRITAASGVPASLGYQSDIGGNLAINPVFRPHVDFTEALIDAIFLAIGAERREKLSLVENLEIFPQENLNLLEKMVEVLA
jgi:hypothetical protein